MRQGEQGERFAPRPLGVDPVGDDCRPGVAFEKLPWPCDTAFRAVDKAPIRPDPAARMQKFAGFSVDSRKCCRL